jgi:hypothetical protein
MQLKTHQQRRILGTASLVSSIVFLSITFGCASKVIRTYGQDGELRELLFSDNDGIKQAITFTHNRPQRTVFIEQKCPTDQFKNMEMKVRYAANGRITFIAKKRFSKDSGKTEAEFDSFSYSKSGAVTKIETSYKSSYSIAQHNTTLIIAQYKYQSGILSEVDENGGTFKKTIKPVYSGASIKSIEYNLFSYNPKSRKFEKTKDVQFYFSGDTVSKAIDKHLKKEYGRRDAARIFSDEHAGRSLEKLKYATDITGFLKEAESFLIERK